MWKVGLKLKLKNGDDDCFVIHDEKTGEDTPLFNFNSQLQLYYSGPIDALFNYKYGALPWRTLRFERETLPVADYQGNSVVNYTDAEVPYMRVHEFKHYHPEWESRVEVESRSRRADGLNVYSSTSTFNFNSSSKTIIMREYSATWQPGVEPHYPINSPESAALLARYQSEVDHFNQTIKQSNNSSSRRPSRPVQVLRHG